MRSVSKTGIQTPKIQLRLLKPISGGRIYTGVSFISVPSALLARPVRNSLDPHVTYQLRSPWRCRRLGQHARTIDRRVHFLDMHLSAGNALLEPEIPRRYMAKLAKPSSARKAHRRGTVRGDYNRDPNWDSPIL